MKDSADTFREESVTIKVRDNDSDPDGDSLTVSSVTKPDDGTATTNGTTVTYTPRLGFLGTDTFSYTVKDPSGASASASVSVTVTERNRPPAAFDDDVTSGGTTITFNVITGAGTDAGTPNADFDPDGDPLTIDPIDMDIVDGVGHLTCGSNGACTWTQPSNCSTVTAKATYTLRDDRGGSDTAVIDMESQNAC